MWWRDQPGPARFGHVSLRGSRKVVEESLNGFLTEKALVSSEEPTSMDGRMMRDNFRSRIRILEATTSR